MHISILSWRDLKIELVKEREFKTKLVTIVNTLKTQCIPILHFIPAASSHHLQSAKNFIAHAKMGASYIYL